MAGRRRRRGESKIEGLAARLGVHGWAALDPILLAALAQEAPLLLVGTHGTAKSLVVERIAAGLRLELRHYNASLLNYDDLVGIPMPEESGDRLRFVATPGAVWDAEFVFLDEVSRCRADLQNKLFPIVHERRVAGVDLPRLRHRWAAMNPPSGDDPDTSMAGFQYLGAEPLDPALADRFSFVVRVPDWGDLSREERRAVVRGNSGTSEAFDLVSLVDRCRERVAAQEVPLTDRIADYVVGLVDQLAGAELALSPRRSRMLLRNAVAVHAARIELGHSPSDVEASVEAALVASLPQTADERPPSAVTVRAAHRQAWELSGLASDDPWRAVLEEPGPVERVVLGDALGLADADLARLVTQALGAQISEPRRIGLATAMFLRFRAARELTPAAWEPLVQRARRVLEPREITLELAQGAQLDGWRELTRFVSSRQNCVTELERNYLLGGYPDLWIRCDWRAALAWFRDDLARLGVEALR